MHMSRRPVLALPTQDSRENRYDPEVTSVDGPGDVVDDRCIVDHIMVSSI